MACTGQLDEHSIHLLHSLIWPLPFPSLTSISKVHAFRHTSQVVPCVVSKQRERSTVGTKRRFNLLKRLSKAPNGQILLHHFRKTTSSKMMIAGKIRRSIVGSLKPNKRIKA